MPLEHGEASTGMLGGFGTDEQDRGACSALVINRAALVVAFPNTEATRGHLSCLRLLSVSAQRLPKPVTRPLAKNLEGSWPRPR